MININLVKRQIDCLSFLYFHKLNDSKSTVTLEEEIMEDYEPTQQGKNIFLNKRYMTMQFIWV